MSENRRQPMLAMLRAFCLLALLTPLTVMADRRQNDEDTLAQIVSSTIKIMRRHGYEMPDYRVVNGGTDVPISGPPERHAFFGYLDKSWFQSNSTITLHFYEADALPSDGRKELIDYLVELHAKQHGEISLSLRMMTERYKKGQVVRPDAFLEMNLKRVEY